MTNFGQTDKKIQCRKRSETPPPDPAGRAEFIFDTYSSRFFVKKAPKFFRLRRGSSADTRPPCGRALTPKRNGPFRSYVEQFPPPPQIAENEVDWPCCDHHQIFVRKNQVPVDHIVLKLFHQKMQKNRFSKFCFFRGYGVFDFPKTRKTKKHQPSGGFSAPKARLRMVHTSSPSA